MNARAVAARLRAEGVACTLHRDGSLTASLTKPADESWSRWLRERVTALPGADVRLVRERPASDRYFVHTEAFFVVGSAA